MKYSIDKKESYTVITIDEKKLDTTVAPDLKSEFVKLNAEGSNNLILDLQNVKYTDSSGLSSILIANRLCNSTGGLLVLTTQAMHSQMQPGYNITFIPVDTEAHAVVYEDALVRVWSLPMRHRIACAGYLFEEQPRRDKLVKERLPVGLSPSELSQLAAGHDLPADEATGRPALAHAEVSVPAAPPRRYAFCSDTRYQPELAELVHGVDLLYHEATFLDDLRERAATTYHSTARQAAQIAQAADAHRLLIGHFSSRYKELAWHLKEAQAVFAWTELATEGLVVSV